MNTSDQTLIDGFDEMLDNLFGEVEIANKKYPTSRALLATDEKVYWSWFYFYIKQSESDEVLP